MQYSLGQIMLSILRVVSFSYSTLYLLQGCSGYADSALYQILFYITVVLSGGIILLPAYWYPAWYAQMTKRKSHLPKSSSVIIQVRAESEPYIGIYYNSNIYFVLRTVLLCTGKTLLILSLEIVEGSDFSDTAYNSGYVSDVQSLIAKIILLQFFDTR